MPVPDFSPGEVLTAAAMDRVGLWRVVPTSVSGTGATLSGSDVVVASGGANFTINGIFSANFRNYKLLFTDFRTASTSDLLLSLGTAASGSSHRYAQIACSTTASIFGQGSGGGTSWPIAVSRGATVSLGASVELLSPFEAIETTFNAMSIDADNAGIFRSTAGFHADNTSFTSLFVSVSSTITSCRVAIYGYN